MINEEKEAINRFLHEAMGGCWCEWSESPEHYVYICAKCQDTKNAFDIPDNPDYLSEDSPCSLLAAVEKMVVEKAGLKIYGNALREVGQLNHWNMDTEGAQFATVSAETRCRALVEVLKGEQG